MKQVLAAVLLIISVTALAGQRGLGGLQYDMDKFDAGNALKSQGYWYEGADFNMEGFENTEAQPQYIAFATQDSRGVTGWMLVYDTESATEKEAQQIYLGILNSLQNLHGVNSYLSDNGDVMWELGNYRYVMVRQVDWERSLQGWLVFYGDRNYPDQFHPYDSLEPFSDGG